MKRLLTMVAIAFLILIGYGREADAATINYKYIDGTVIEDGGTAVTTDNTVTTTEFTEAKTAVATAGKTVVAYVNEDNLAQGLLTPVDTPIASGGTVIVVTEDMVTTDNTEFGDGAKWFIYEDKLYVVSQKAGGSTIEDNVSDSNTYNRGISAGGKNFDIKSPSMEKADIDVDGYGMAKSAVGDEQTLTGYYDYTPNPDDEKVMQTGDKDSISLTGVHVSRASKADSLMDAGKLPWIDHAGEITEINLGTDITINGNIAQMFNGHTIDGSGSRYEYIFIAGSGCTVEESLYTSLETVNIYSDLSGVTTTAAMFARCPRLTKVLGLNADGSAMTTLSLPNVKTTAFMFYGDEVLDNSYEGSIANIMDLSAAPLKNTMYMYAGCENIVKPHVSTYKMDDVETIDGMFQGATNAQITFDSGDESVAGWDVSNVKSALYTFMGVIPKDDDGNKNYKYPTKNVSPGLGDIETNRVVDGTADLTTWDLAQCVSTYHMFAQNLGVTGVEFDNSYPALVDAAGMFNGCDNLRTVDMANASTPVLKYVHAMFRRAGSKTTGGTADLSNWTAGALKSTVLMFEASGFETINMNGTSDMSNVEELIAMFADNPALVSLGSDNLSHFRLTSALDTQYMFDGDSALENVDVTDWGMPNVKNISHMYADCESLAALDTGAWSVGSGTGHVDGCDLTDMECFAYNTGIATASMEDWDTTHLINMYMAYANNAELTEAILPEVADAFVVLEDANGAFYNCPKLVSVYGTDVTNTYEAPALVDARGMFADDVKLTRVGLPAFVQSNAVTIAYMYKNCEALESLSIDDWDTSGVEFMQGLYDGCKKIEAINTGNDFRANALKDMGNMFRNCHELISPSAVIANFTDTPELKDMYHTFENDYKMAELDISHMDLSKVTDLRHLAYMEECEGVVTNRLTTIKLPSTIMTADGLIENDASDGHGTSINAFWVDGDGEADGNNEENGGGDDLLTTLFIDGEIPAKLKAYNFGGDNNDNDNRSFVSDVGRYINGIDTGAYTFTSPTDKAILSRAANSKLYKNGTDTATATNVPLAYSWVKGDEALACTENSYTTEANASGAYQGSVLPGELTGSNTIKTRTFNLSAFPVVDKQITATYTGPNIMQGHSYSKDDVTVVYTDDSGVEHTLTTTDWSVPSLVVPALGANTYTATYDPGDGELTATFTVTGVEAGEPFISAVYMGDDILVGNNYLKSDVKVLYTKDDGTTTLLDTADFMLSGTKVTSVGDNTFTATYIDPDGVTLTDTLIVTGYELATGLEATYKGGTVPVGSNYSKDDVEVILTLADGTKVTLSPDDFTVDSQKVTKKGDNEFTVTYNDGVNTYTDTITVPGKRVIGSIVSTYTGPSVLVGNDYDTANVTTMAYYADDVAKAEGFQVAPSGYSTTKVSNVGANNITATYRDPDQDNKAFTSVFKVTGYKNVASIGATYTGDKIKVGDNYDKNKVKVTVYYDDGTSSTADSFTVDSLVVTGEGSNSYTATYRDAFGNTYTAGYTVPGYKDSSTSSSSSSGTSGTLGDYAAVSSVWPYGTGYAMSTPVGYGTGTVKTGRTSKSILYVVAFLVLMSMLATVIVARHKQKKK